jgi:hypothetical protein
MPKHTLLALGLASALALPAAASAQITLAGLGGPVPDDTPAGLSLPISVTDDFTVTDLTVSLTWPDTATFGTTVRDGHTWAGDLVATLTYDDGLGTIRTATLFNRLGKTSPVSGSGYSADLTGTYTFADGGADLWAAAAIATALPGSVPNAVYQPADNAFNFAASTADPVSLTDTFSGLSSRGTWTLTLADMAGGEIGALEGWSLTLVPAPGPAALAALGALTFFVRRRR